MERIASLGDLGQVVEVKAGYARNFLIPVGKAKLATAENLAYFEARQEEFRKQQEEALARARAKAETLEGLTLQIARRAYADGRIYGSVGAGDVVEALNALDISVERQEVRISQGPIKTVGDHAVEIVLHPDVVVPLTVSVLGET